MSEEATPNLHMPHITQSVEDARKAIEKRVKPTEADLEEKKDEENPRAKETYVFDFDFTDRSGKRWHGKFQNRVRSIMDRQLQANMQAGWQGGIPYDGFEPDAAFLNQALAHLAITLTPIEGSQSFTLDDLRKAHDIGVVNALYEEVLGHEATFLKRNAPAKRSPEGGTK